MNTYRQRQFEKAARALMKARGDVATPLKVVTLDPRLIDPLHGVQFVSDAAHATAEKYGMTWESFARSVRTPSNDGGYTTRDVHIIHRDEVAV